MLLLVTGASGAGKSTARRLIEGELGSRIHCVELCDVADVPALPTLAWRQQATEAAVVRASELRIDGQHLLLSGDPVAAGEVIAAPSADRLDGVAVCLLDVDERTQTARLSARGDDPAQFVHHIAFASWMRGHAREPGHGLEVLCDGGWDAMQWERVTARDHADWGMEVLETSGLTADQVATRLVDWCRRALAGRAPVMLVDPERSRP